MVVAQSLLPKACCPKPVASMTKPSFTKTSMSKPRSSRGGRRLTIADHVDALPLQQKLSSAQQMLVKLAPHWHQWRLQHFSAECHELATLSHFENGQLDIACSNASVASGIKHLQDSLITFLNHQGFNEINRVNIRIDLPTGSGSEGESNAANTTSGAALAKNIASQFIRPSDNSIESIKQCQKQSKNSALAEALQRLRETLENR